MTRKTTKKTVSSLSIALQGGGTHAAFAWGALDCLLSNGITISALSATSGGAMNGVILAEGWRINGPEGAREHLQAFWRKVSIAARMLPLQHGTFDRFLSDVGIDFSPSTIALDYLTKLFSPYQFNLFDFNPMREILAEMIDFDALAKRSPFPLFINATHVTSGEGKVFSGKEISLEAIMASSCLPYLFKTVMINGEPYWDGSYSGNPALTPLYKEANAADILLVQTLSLNAEEIPTKAADILDRATEISFNTAFLSEKRMLEEYNNYHPDQKVNLMVLEAQDTIGSLSRGSKLNADWDFLLYLHDLGFQAAGDYLGIRTDE